MRAMAGGRAGKAGALGEGFIGVHAVEHLAVQFLAEDAPARLLMAEAHVKWLETGFWLLAAARESACSGVS